MIALGLIVAMTVVGWVPQPDGTLKEVWRIEETVPLRHCLEMGILTGGGKHGAITVRCKRLDKPMWN